MQDIHSIGGGALGLLGASAGAGAGDRRLRHHHHHHHHHHHPALKCPRCESLNTKFCYYNNYNLSQPRHFCKNCRRYWTMGGVLRNVPVGGGSRKTKRSKTKPPRQRKCPSSQNSSSDGSSLTASTAAVAANSTATPTAPTTATEAEVFLGFDLPALDQLSAGFNFAGDVSSFRQQWIQPPENLMAEMSVGFMDQMGLQNTVSNGGPADQGLFDLMGAVDQAYWSQIPWNYHDHDYQLNHLN